MKVSEPGTPSSEPSLSIVVITRNTQDLLRNLLKSAQADRQLKPILADVTVIDNHSTDGTVSMVRREFPWVFLVENDRNTGFAAAANMGISRSRGSYVLFLNSDTVLMEGEVPAMVQFMNEEPHVGICGPQLVYEDMRPQRSYAHIPSLLFEIVPRSFLEFLFPTKYSAKHALKKEAASATGGTLDSQSRTSQKVALDVPSLIGAAIVARKELLDSLGGFDEGFFFFLEETDLCIRAKREGARVVFLPSTKVVHLQGRTVRKNWVEGRIQYNISLYRFIRKHHGGLYYRLFQGIRLVKSFFVPLLLTAAPVLLLHRRTRMTYGYYARLFLWHVRGCPEDGGLLLSSPG